MQIWLRSILPLFSVLLLALHGWLPRPANAALQNLQLETTLELGGLILAGTWTPDGESLAISRGEEILLLAGGGETVEARFWVSALTRALAFSPNRVSLLAAGSNDGRIRFLEGGDLSLSRSIEIHPKGINRLAFQPGGDLLASAGNDALVYLWDQSTGEGVGELIGGAFAVPDLVFTPDGSLIITVDGGVIRIREVETGRLVRSIRASESVPAVAVDPQGRYIVSAARENTLQVWNLETGALEQEQVGPADSQAWELLIHPTQDLVVSGWRDGSICWSTLLASAELNCRQAHQRPVGMLALHPGGETVVSGGYDGLLISWKLVP